MIKKYKAKKDNTITDAYKTSAPTSTSLRATGSNMGASDILEVFTIYGACFDCEDAADKKEKARILIQFDVDKIIEDRNNNVIPSGSTYYLKMYNATSTKTVPRPFTLDISSLSQDWEEGIGLDMDLPYTDETYGVIGSNWIQRSGTAIWKDGGTGSALPGAIDDMGRVFSASFSTGLENIEVNITSLVNDWIGGAKSNYGVGIRLSPDLENLNKSYYTKRFFGRGTNRFFDRPVIEAQWDSSVRDDRGQFYTSSSLVPATDNMNTLYLYNYARGRLQDIPAVIETDGHPIRVALYDNLGDAFTLCNDQTHYVGGRVSKGIYSASVCVETLSSSAFDVWHLGTTQFHTGSINTKPLNAYSYSDTSRYVLSVSNKNTSYKYEQTHRIRLYSRQKNWSPNIYNTAANVPNSLIFESASYQIYRVVDDKVVVPYGTGSTDCTRLSYDVSGNYFDLDTSLLEPNYTYGVNFSIYDPDTQSYEEQPYIYKLRVVNNEY
jgi:hypothetical protein